MVTRSSHSPSAAVSGGSGCQSGRPLRKRSCAAAAGLARAARDALAYSAYGHDHVPSAKGAARGGLLAPPDHGPADGAGHLDVSHLGLRRSAWQVGSGRQPGGNAARSLDQASNLASTRSVAAGRGPSRPSRRGQPAAGRADGRAGAATTLTGSARTAAARTGTTARLSLPACQLHDVVLSLFSSQASYTVRQTPAFQLDVVSTGSRTCTFDVGAWHVLLRISAGSHRIWTSAECAEGQASVVTKLYRGIPVVVPVAWNGQRSSPGCPVPGNLAPPGSYTALAIDGPLTSNSLTFRIG